MPISAPSQSTLIQIRLCAGIAALAMLLSGCGDSNDSGSSGPPSGSQFSTLSENEKQDLCATFASRFDNYVGSCDDRSAGEITCDDLISEVDSCSTDVSVGDIRGCGSALRQLSCEEDGVSDEPLCEPLNNCLDGALSNPHSGECPEGEVYATGPGIDEGCFLMCTSDSDCQPGESCTPASSDINLCIGE